jgi:hypothetical protein
VSARCNASHTQCVFRRFGAAVGEKHHVHVTRGELGDQPSRFAADIVGKRGRDGAELGGLFLDRCYELGMLMAYGALASYAFGVIMNLWFWPIAVGSGTTVSFVEGAGFLENITRFVVYSLASSTLTWDTVRAITTVIGLALVGKTALQALRRGYVRPVPVAT